MLLAQDHLQRLTLGTSRQNGGSRPCRSGGRRLCKVVACVGCGVEQVGPLGPIGLILSSGVEVELVNVSTPSSVFAGNPHEKCVGSRG